MDRLWSTHKRLVLAFMVVTLSCISIVLLFEFSRYADEEFSYPSYLEHHGKNSITVSFKGRTGNHMFEYAALLGVADHNNMTPVISEDTSLVDVFDIQLPRITSRNAAMFHVVSEKLAGAYNTEVIKLSKMNRDLYLDGFLQSWKYFDHIKIKLKKKYYIFHKHLLKEADDFLNNARTTLKKSKTTMFIGMHIRRGDFVHAKRRGYGVAPIPYFYRAMNYFLKKYKDVIFIVCSNGLNWCKDNLDSDSYPIQYSTQTGAGEDLALLSRCNHSIISVGSFSWWSGYLAGGEVVYPAKAFPIPNTSIGDSYVRADYFPPWWIPK